MITIRNKQFRTSTLLLVGSFLLAVLLMTFTSPVQNIGYAIVFFGAAGVFVSSVIFSLLGAGGRRVSAVTKYRIAVVTISLILLMMFRSAQSLNIVDIIVLSLLAGGMLFYGGRRLQ